jgi:Arc/MetJ family transcription regulator
MRGFNYILVDVDDGLFVIGSAYRNYNIRSTMRTTIDIDDDLLAEAMAATGLATKKATVDEALRLLARQHRRRQAIQDMAKLGWEGDLDAIRKSRPDDPRL